MSTQLVWGDIPQSTQELVLQLLEKLKMTDIGTYEHCLRVGNYSRKLARDLGLNEYEQKTAEYSGLLHDIGKMQIEKGVLHKPSRLDDIELEHMQTHSCLSEQIVRPLGDQNIFFKTLLPAIRGHHERIDGRGYPDKKCGDEISLFSRIILIVDTYDAMTVDRVYRKGLPKEKAFEEIKKFSGTQFDLQIVNTFLRSNQHWSKQADIFPELTSEQIIFKKTG